MKKSYALVALVALLAVTAATLAVAQTAPKKDMIWTDEKGRIRPEPTPVDPKFNNPWSPELEDAFLTRADHAIRHFADVKVAGNTWGENEKDSYPKAMMAILNGRRDEALKVLQGEDAQARTDHTGTRGIDLYWNFTIKGQTRKYFYFGEFLDEAYRDRMTEAAKLWTEKDPLRREHPVYGKGDPSKGVWGPENKGSWVDVRSTDNLRAMRDTSVYLMAEATGNKETAAKYKENIKDYVYMLYNVGMMEWDSENYHGHTLAPYHNLYDFAKDPEVKLLAKAALDWLYAAGAVKYYRGGFGGPNARDYGGANVVFGANVASSLSLYFGENPIPDPEPDRDDLYHVTSAYRPPEAVVALGKKQFTRPVEIFATKPVYKLWKAGEPVKPRFWETQQIGLTYQLGSAVSEQFEEIWDVNPFKFIAFNSKRGADLLAATTVPDDNHGGKYKGDQIGQYENLLIWLRPAKPVVWQQKPKEKPDATDLTFAFQWPAHVSAQYDEGVWYLPFEKTWVAIFPINLNKPEKQEIDGKREERYKDESRWHAKANLSDSYAGFAMLVGEEPQHKSFEAFKTAVKERAKLNLNGLAQGSVQLVGIEGKSLTLTYNKENDLPTVQRDSVKRNWYNEMDVYKPATGIAPIYSPWQKGTLRVEAGGKVFTSQVTPEGKVTFSNETAK